MPEANARARRAVHVPEQLQGERWDRVASALFPEFSRAQLQRWMRSGALRLDGAVVKPNEPAPLGATLSLDAELPVAPAPWSAQDMPLDIAYEDATLIVADKPAGLVVHPGAGHAEGTMANALVGRYPELASLPRVGLVHRLDKDTSGLMVIARNDVARRALATQFSEHSAQREYLAICAGALTGDGMVDAPVGRHPVQRQKIAVRQDGREAVTHYRLLRRFSTCSYISLRLETGRTHQIRVHLAHIGHPLLGDPQYGRCRQGAAPMSRQALHATSLGLRHPDSGELMHWHSPLPVDFQALLDAEIANASS